MIKNNFQSIIQGLSGKEIKIITVTKKKPVTDILEVYQTGHKIFGENIVQELLTKYPLLPKDIEWHMIGHLQRNKVKYIVPFISMIQSVDSINLLEEIDKQAIKFNRKIPCLLEVHIASEQSKQGFNIEEMDYIITKIQDSSFQNISVCGLMGIASFTENKNQIREEFRILKSLFQRIKTTFFSNDSTFAELSIGMSDDYKIAVEEGSTMVRIGSKIFGKR